MVSPEQILAAQNGNQQALTDLLRAVEKDAYKTAYYLLGNEQDARDTTQEALIRVCRNLHKYETKAMFRTWVQKIVTNLCIDLIRKRKEQVSIDQADLVLQAPDRVEGQVIQRETEQNVAAAMQQLGEPYRSVVILRYVNQFSYEEIAETLNLPINTVKSHLFRAKTQLQRLLKDYAKGGEQQ